jgi:hypothetical protein
MDPDRDRLLFRACFFEALPDPEVDLVSSGAESTDLKDSVSGSLPEFLRAILVTGWYDADEVDDDEAFVSDRLMDEELMEDFRPVKMDAAESVLTRRIDDRSDLVGLDRLKRFTQFFQNLIIKNEICAFTNE